MLVDMHAHTSAISHCCKADTGQVLKTAKENGFDAIVLTNHYVWDYYTQDTYNDWIEKYLDEWHNCRELGKQLGVKVFCGAEITMRYDPRVHLLIYGADEQFYRNNERLCDLTLEQLYSLCSDAGCALVQAHPFRNGTTIQCTDYLDGVEVNCHSVYHNSYAAEVIAGAAEASLAVSVGCDYHADAYRAKGGVFLPELVKTDRDIADFVLNSDSFHLKIHEPLDGQIYEITVNR